ncbi:DNA damage-inducible protein 1 [Tilletia horrida]|uniref:DNA damage-inducible protein 1 n=1 Tax=Tilletia horrida TaxID=155126 RepID=A0AAN6GCS2_9BASI|nr:DNA damage-inducible protein 1 [Tilletia horrida]KAK0560018.1 DNA damage-inducible protein 1 [Tilletia horrida]
MLTVVTDTDALNIDADASITVETLKAIIEADTGIPAAQQLLLFNSTPVEDASKTLASYGFTDSDLLLLQQRRAQPQASSSAAGAGAGAGAGASAAGARTGGAAPGAGPSSGGARPLMPGPGHQNIEAAAETLRLQLLSNPTFLQQIRATRPELADAVTSSPERFLQLLEAERARTNAAQSARLQAEHDLANADEFDIEAQRKIEEAIRQERVMENLEHAMEFSPESFGRVTMLYVDSEVNGTPVKAFVDSGAQATIMSPECAERCGIMRLIDTRFAGIARGVGTARILGRVHSAQLKLGEELFLPCSFTIMEGKGVELLFGLDMLKRFQATIDLASNALVIQGKRVRFLDEHELPESAKVEETEAVDDKGNPLPPV